MSEASDVRDPLPGSVPAAAVAEEPPAKLSTAARSVIAILVVCAGAALFWPRGSEPTFAPAGTLFDLEGHATTLGPRLSPVTLVHFWATWCAPCIQEVPALKRLSIDYASRPEIGVLMVAVADSQDKVKTFLGMGSNEALFDPSWEVAHRYGTDKIPETYLIVKGKIVEKFVGQTNWDDPAIRSRIDQAALQAAGSQGG